MASIKHQIEYIFTRLFFGLIIMMSDKTADSFGKFLGRLGGKLLPKRREIALENLHHAFKETKTETEYNEIVVKTFESIGQTMIDLARSKRLSQLKLSNKVNCPDLSAFDIALKNGRGGVITTAHYGNWELAGAWVADLGYPLDIIIKVQSNPLVDKYVVSLRSNFDYGIIQIRNTTLRKVLQSLKQNRFIILAADQHDPSGSLVLDFFGRKASIAKGPATFARKQNCPIIPIVMRRKGFDDYEVITTEGIYPSFELDEKEDIIRMTKEYLSFLEDVITKYPEQWMWTHRRWKL